MSKLEQAARQALEALEGSCYPRLSTKHTDRYEEAINALEKALAEQETVAKYSDIVSDGGLDPRNAIPVRTKDLTEQEIQDAIINISPTGTGYFLRIARAVIAADREKNK